jgi:hypothetical protein
MESEFANVNWLAVIVGTIVAYGLGMLWFSPRMFGTKWSTGSHNIQPPASPPMGAMIVQFLATLFLALVVGITATSDALITALLAIFAVAAWILASGIFSQKSGGAAMIDAGYVVASGAIMIAAQGIF